MNSVVAAMVSFHILYVFSEEYVKESDEDLDEKDLEDNDMAIPRRCVEEMVRFSSRIRTINRWRRLLRLRCFG